MCCGTEAGSYLRLIDSCVTQLKAQGPSRTCNKRKEEKKDGPHECEDRDGGLTQVVAGATELGQAQRLQ